MKGYLPQPKNHTGIVFLVVVGLIALPAAIHALISLLPLLILIAVVSLIGGILIGRKNYF